MVRGHVLTELALGTELVLSKAVVSSAVIVLPLRYLLLSVARASRNRHF